MKKFVSGAVNARLLTATAIIACSWMTAAHAENSAQPITIPAQSLGTALLDYIRQSKQQLLYSPEVVRGKFAPSLNGFYSPDQALGRLLAGSGIRLKRTPGGAYLLWAPTQSNAGETERAVPPAEAPAKGAGVEDIVVTAQKRGERVNSIPTSISAYDTAKLVDRGVTDTKQLEMITPGLLFTTSNNVAQPYVRGIGAENAQIAAESPLAIYIDGVYRPALYAGIQDLSNTERVEVLLGPQGTLYGRNSTAGAINIITRDPTAETRANASISYGNKDAIRGSAFVSGGNDTIAASLGVLHNFHDGFTLNLADGTRVNDKRLDSLRGKVKLTPSSRFSATLAMDYTTQHDKSASAFTYIPSDGGRLAKPLPLLLGGRVSTAPRETYVDSNYSFTNLTDWGLGLTMRYALDTVDLVSITGYSHTKLGEAADIDTSDLPLEISTSTQSQWTGSQEFQVVSNTPASRLKWIVGAYGFRSRAGFDSLFVGAPSSLLALIGEQRTVAFAGFGQATYAVTDPFKITVGLRYSNEQKTLLRSEIVDVLTTPQQSKRWTDFSPKLTLEYSFAKSLLYFTASKGFKSGNYNVLGFGAPPVNPETVVAFEIGGKHALAHSAVQFNWSAFAYNYKDLQVSIVENALVLLENAASSRIYGADANVTFNLGSGLSGQVGGSYLHARYRNYPHASVYLPDPKNGGYGNVFVSQDVSGNQNVRSPKVTFDAGLNYTTQTPIGKLSLSGNYYYNDGFFFDTGNTVRQKAYAIVNARAELGLGNSGITLFTWVDNLTNRNVLTGLVQVNFGNLATYNDPRLYGVGAKMTF